MSCTQAWERPVLYKRVSHNNYAEHHRKAPRKSYSKVTGGRARTERVVTPTLGSYRRGKDTWMNADVLASDVFDGFEKKEEMIVIALDLDDAYNRV